MNQLEFAKDKWRTMNKMKQDDIKAGTTLLMLICWLLGLIFMDVNIIVAVIWTIATIIFLIICAIVTAIVIKDAAINYLDEYQEWKKKPKNKAKTNGEQMATLDELFEDYEEHELPPPDRERGTPHTIR